MKIVILGGNGFVGQNVNKVLMKEDYEIISLSKSNGLDLLDYNLTKGSFQKFKPNIIINCAAKVGSLNYVTKQAADVFDINMRMLLNIYKAIQDVSGNTILINPIANCSYPGDIDFYTESKFWEGKVHHSVYAYGNTRRMIEVLSECYKMQYGLKVINLIVPNMYGPFDSTDPNKAHALNALTSKIIKAKKENWNEVEVWGSGIAIREWLYASDFGKITAEIVQNIEKPGFDEPFNIAQNFGISVRELVGIIIKSVGYKGEIKWNRNMPDGALRKVMDDVRFRKLFPSFEFTSLENGLKQTSNYYESIYPY